MWGKLAQMRKFGKFDSP